MSCGEFVAVLSAGVDAELDGSERQAIESHAEGCDVCRMQRESFRSLKHAVSRLEGRTAPSEAVFARVAGHRFEHGASRRPKRHVWLGGAAVAAAAAVLVTWVAVRSGGDASLSHQLIADHLKYVGRADSAEITSSNGASVVRFFDGRVPFTPVAPTLQGTTLIGGRVCSIQGATVQLLFYERGRQKLSLYVTATPPGIEGCDSAGDYRLCIHQRGELTLMVVGDQPEGQLRRLLNEATL